MTSSTTYFLARATCAVAIFTALLGSTAASPLYPVYIRDLGLSQFMATAIFAVYSIGTLASLFLAPRIAARVRDERKIMIAGLVLAGSGAVIFALAQSLLPLLVGRLFSGAGTGMIAGLASVALYELAPWNKRKLAATIATLAFTGGAAGGPLLTSAMLAIGYAPKMVPFLFIAAMSVVSIIGLVFSRWPDLMAKGRATDGFETPVETACDPVQGPAPALFRLACLAVAIAWMIGAAIMATGANWGLELFGFGSASLAALIPTLFMLTAGFGQALFGRLHSLNAILLGAGGIAIAQVALVIAAPGAHGLVLMVVTPLCGLFYGAGFVGGLGLANAAADPQRRAIYVSIFYTTGYLANAIPTVGFGILIDRLGIATAFNIFSVFLILITLGVAGYAQQQRRKVFATPRARACKSGIDSAWAAQAVSKT